MSILNIQPKGRGVRATDKQLQVGSLLAEFDFNRKNAAKAMQKAIDDAVSVGADFATAYSQIAFKPTRNLAEQNTALDDLQAEFDAALDKYKDANQLNSDAEILDYEPSAGPNSRVGDGDRKFFDFLVKESIIFPVRSGQKEKPKFYIIPVVLPAFTSNPIGWDRRWMIATMKIIDEYWDMIYNPNRKILIQDLLFLIATKTKELFNYDIDVVQMTILTLLLTPQRNARRRARSIMPRNAAGEVPLRSLTQLLKDSARDEPAPGAAVNLERKLKRVQEQIALNAAADDELKEDLRFIQDTANETIGELDEFRDGIARAYATSQPILVGDFLAQIDPIIASLEAPVEDEAKVNDFIKDAVDELINLTDDFNDGKTYEAFKRQKDELDGVIHKLEKTFLYSKTYLGTLNDIDDLKALIDEFKLRIDHEEPDPTAADANAKKERAANEIQADLYQKRTNAKRRAARRGRRSSTMKEIGFVTAEVVVGTNVLKDVGMSIRDLVGGRSNRLEKMVNESMKILVAELYERAESKGADYVGEIRIQPIVYGGATMLTLIAHGVAYDTGGKKVKSNPPRMLKNPMEEGRVDAYDSYMLAKNAAIAQANKYDETVYLWREDGKIKVSRFFPGKVLPKDVTAIHPNPPPEWRFIEASMKKVRRDPDDIPSVYPMMLTQHGLLYYNIFLTARNAPQNYDREDIYFDEHMPGRGEDIDVFYLDREEEAMGRFPGYRYIGTLQPIKKLGNVNPPSKKSSSKKPTERKYKGMIISKVDDGWEVVAYGKVFKTLKEARDFISKKVKGTAAPNQQCVRIIAGTRCIGTIVKVNKGGHYQCKNCKAKYKAV